MKPQIFVILGSSRSGKDTLANIFLELFPGENIKFKAPMREVVEFYYDLPAGSLDDDVTRFQEVPDLPGVTYLDIMIRCWEYFPHIDPYWGIRKTKKRINQSLLEGKNLVFTDVRNQVEVDCLLDLNRNTDVLLRVVRLHKETAIVKPSDVHLESYQRQLESAAIASIEIENNGSKLDLRKQFLDFMGFCLPLTSPLTKAA